MLFQGCEEVEQVESEKSEEEDENPLMRTLKLSLKSKVSAMTEG